VPGAPEDRVTVAHTRSEVDLLDPPIMYAIRAIQERAWNAVLRRADFYADFLEVE
jgi:hypothetical protein